MNLKNAAVGVFIKSFSSFGEDGEICKKMFLFHILILFQEFTRVY